MNVMTSFTTKSLRANKARTIVTIIGVALAAALLTAVLTSFTSLTDFLYRSEVATSGTWMAKVQVEDTSALASDLEHAQDDPSVTDIATLYDLGFAELTQKQQQRFGPYLPILAYEGDIANMLGIHTSEGRLPENENEILLFDGWQSSQGVNVGDKVTFQVGERIAQDAGGSSSVESGEIDAGEDDPSVAKTYTITPGTQLNSSMGYLDAHVDGTGLDETLENKQVKTYTVVGFYDRLGYALYSGVGPVAITAESSTPALAAFAEVYLTLSDVQNTEEVQDKAEALFPDDRVELHNGLLRYMGISSDTSIWTTFYGLVLILSIVIIVACISLIFNAFAISVAERKSQFGLLSSVGAAQRQLRRAVILEALVVAVVGIPLGLLVGIGGCAITFAALGPAITKMVGNVDEVAFGLSVDPWVILATTVLTLVTVLLSVWIPAKRASKANIIDSLKSSGGSQASKRGRRLAAAATIPARLWKSRGISGRLFGIGGKLAAINRKRGTTKGKTAAVSLALAIVLLMTAGSLNTFLGSLVGAVSGGNVTAGEVAVIAQLDQASENGSERTTANEQLAHANERFAKEARVFADAYDQLSGASNAEGQGWKLTNSAPLIVPHSIAGSMYRSEDVHTGGELSDGDYALYALMAYIDDASFDEYARSLGLDPSEYYDPEHPRAIGVSRCYGNDGSRYQLMEALQGTGETQVLSSAVYQNRYPAHITIQPGATSNNELAKWSIGAVASSAADDDIEGKMLTLDEVDYASTGLDIAALAEEPPAVLGKVGDYLCLIMPVSLAQGQAFGLAGPTFTGEFDSRDGDHAALLEELTKSSTAFFSEECPYDLAFSSYNDHIEERESVQMMATIVNVFCLLFTVILALIALANVFNTITNSLILRRREFAVMKSIGMSNKQFRRMIMNECMSFGITGLIPGLIVSAGISYLLYLVVGESLGGLTFTLPWGYVALAIGMTAVAMAASVAYGMHRCKADNVVEALRADSI